MKSFPEVMLKTEQFRLDPHNAHVHADGDIQRLVGVIGEHGFLVPLVVDAASVDESGALPTYQLVGGEARLEAGKACNYSELPAVLATFPTLKHRTAAAIALNVPYGKPDDAKLSELLVSLESEIDLDYTGLQPWRLEDLMISMEQPTIMQPQPFTGDYVESEEEYQARVSIAPPSDMPFNADAVMREVVLRFNAEDHRNFNIYCATLSKLYGTSSMAQTILTAIRHEAEYSQRVGA